MVSGLAFCVLHGKTSAVHEHSVVQNAKRKT